LSFALVFNPAKQYIGIMKSGGKKLVWLAGGLALCVATTAGTAAAADSPYQGIVERNVFGLKPPPPPPNPEDNKPPPPKIMLTGITTILGNKRALLKFTPPPKPGDPAKEQAYTLAEGEREGGLEVLEIDEKAGTVKVNNYGTVATLDFETNGIKTPTAAAPPGVPPPIRPGMPMPGAGVPGMGTPMPQRPLRVPPGAGAAVAPQATGGAGLSAANTGVNPAMAQAPVQEGSSSLEENLMLLELNRIKNQPMVDAGLMPPLPRHEQSDDMRAAILGSDPAAGQTATPQPVRLPLPPGGPQQLPLTQ
jgi:hypothetical protein